MIFQESNDDGRTNVADDETGGEETAVESLVEAECSANGWPSNMR